VNRLLGIGLAGILIVGVLAAIFISVAGHQSGSTGSPLPQLTTVRGVIGSEKKAFFEDAQVKRIFAQHGLDVVVDTAGSREIATTFDLSRYDFAFPAGVPTATKIAQSHHVNVIYQPFYSPMAIATFQPIVQLLEAAGVARSQNGYISFDMAAYLAMVQKNGSELAQHPDPAGAR
jgi:predicted SAM-dependent methyltransferase